MTGLALGAARQRAVDPSLLCYERIAGIEYIEMDPDLPYPASAAYRTCEHGAEMLLRANVPDVERVSLDEGQARRYLEALVEAGLFAWQRVYRPAQGTFAVVSTQWRIEVSFTSRGLATPKPFAVEGEDAFPDGYAAVRAALMAPFGRDGDGQPAT